MSHYNLALLGFGNVGRALARLLQQGIAGDIQIKREHVRTTFNDVA